MSKGKGKDKRWCDSKCKGLCKGNPVVKSIILWLKACDYQVYRFATNHGSLYLYAVLECQHTLFVEVGELRKQSVEYRELESKVKSVPNNYYIYANTLSEFITAINKIINGQ